MDLIKDAEAARSALTTMWSIRRFEEAVDDLFARGMMHGTMHLSIGQEAVPVGACAELRDGDYITSTHRGHGHCIARGARLDRMMAELMGRVLGWTVEQRDREVENYRLRVAAERASQEQQDDETADAARLGAPDVVPVRVR